MSNSVQPHRQQPTRLLCPWDSPGKTTGVGCHFLLQCMKVKSEREVAQWCPTLSDPMDCSPLSMGFSRQKYWSGMPLPSPKSVSRYCQIWQPTPVVLPGESQGQRSLVGCCLWSCTESDTTESTEQQQLSFSFSLVAQCPTL